MGFPWGSEMRPINSQAARGGQRHRSFDPITQRAKEIERLAAANQLHREGSQCPYCGKYRIGLNDHIRAKHPKNITNPEPPVPIEQPTRQITTLTPPKQVRRISCAYCGRHIVKYDEHRRKMHCREVTECPHCYRWFNIQSGGLRKCPSCKNQFTLNRNYKAKGASVECPHCFDEFYSEKSGRVRCAKCKRMVHLNKNLTVKKDQ